MPQTACQAKRRRLFPSAFCGQSLLWVPCAQSILAPRFLFWSSFSGVSQLDLKGQKQPQEKERPAGQFLEPAAQPRAGAPSAWMGLGKR